MAPATDSSVDESDSMFSDDVSAAPPNIPRNIEIIEIDDDDDDEEETGQEGSEEEDEELDDEESEDLMMMEDGEDEVDDEDEDEDVMEIETEEEEEDEGEEPPNGAHSNGVNGIGSTDEGGLFPSKIQPDAINVASGSSSPNILRPAELQEALHPLRHTADRVVKQIEAFASSLDNFRRKALHPDDPQTFREACKLVKKYQEIAEETAKQLSKSGASKKPTKFTTTIGHGDAKEAQNQAHSEKVGEKIKRCQLEAETWELVYHLLSVDDPESLIQGKRNEKTALQSLHRYSTDSEIWEQFLEADHFALENVLVLKWLEKSARTSTKDLDSLISKLEGDANRGHGLWAHGWLYTKEAIKGAKRLRSWPQPIDPEDPGITASLLSSEQNKPLITQLDPDAVTRQGLGLERQDQFHEQATWLTCWKMLRLGESWSTILEWAKERLENWRAVSLCGSSVDPSSQGKDPSYSGLIRMMNYRSQDSWRSACSVLASNPNTNQFERAVYALISGETGSAYEVCQSWSDFLYVFCNHVILSRYRDFCKQLQRKLSYAPTGTVPLSIEPAGYESIRNFLDNLMKDERTAAEAKNPYHTIQAAVLGKSYNTFFYHQANATTKVATESKKSTIVPKDAVATNFDDSNLIAANDDDSLRIIAHLFLVLRTVGLVRSDSHYLETASVNVIRYIDLLRKSGNTEAVPIYSSLLPIDMGHEILGKVLIEVTKPEERKAHIQVMKRLKIDIPAVLQSQWRWVLSEADAKEDPSKPVKLKRAVIIEPGEIGRIVPIKKGLIGPNIAPEEERLIRSLDWNRYVDGQWPRLCTLGTYLYKRFISPGRFAAARELCLRTKLSQLPMDISGLGPEEQSDAENDDAETVVEAPASPTKASPAKSSLRATGYEKRKPARNQSKGLRETLFLQAETMKELEQLVWAFDALEKWGDRMDEYENISDPGQKANLKKKLQHCLDQTTEAIEPLRLEWLTNPKDDVEAKELEFIRSTYLPEVILAYHSALYYAGHIIGREIFTQCMTLATAVSSSPTLTESFVSAGRMRELVDAFALSSLALMAAPKKTKLKRKLPHGANLDIWNVKPLEEEDEEEEGEEENEVGDDDEALDTVVVASD